MTLFTWLALGSAGMYLGGGNFSFYELSAYFAAMLVPVGTYIFGESARSSHKSTLFLRGRSSKREIATYLYMAVWFAVGVFGIMQDVSMAAIAAYFATLTPFISAYLIGETYKPSGNKKAGTESRPINS